MSINARYKAKNQLFVKRSQYISIKNPLHKQSEKASMCFKTRRAVLATIRYMKIADDLPSFCHISVDITFYALKTIR